MSFVYATVNVGRIRCPSSFSSSASPLNGPDGGSALNGSFLSKGFSIVAVVSVNDGGDDDKAEKASVGGNETEPVDAIKSSKARNPKFALALRHES